MTMLEGLARAANRAIDVGCTAAGDRGEQSAVGRTDHVKSRAIGGLTGSSVNERIERVYGAGF
jgi:hypothetical protein